MKHHIHKSFAAITLLAVLGWGSAAFADTKVRASSFEYDASGLLTKEVIEPDSPNDCLQTSYTYDTFGNKTGVTTSACAGATGYAIASATTPRTATSSFGVDGRFPLNTSNVLGQSETKVYDSRFGATSSLVGPNSLATQWEYDGFGRKGKETRSDGTYTTWAYKLCTDTGISCPGPIGGATITWVAIEQSYAANAATSTPEKRDYYDSLNRLVRSQTAGFEGAGVAPALVQDTEYDPSGRIARRSNLYKLVGGTAYWVSFAYDVLGRVIREESPDPDAVGGFAVTTQSYNGLTTVVTNSKGQTKTTTKNSQGQVVQVLDAQGHTVIYTYDALGQLTKTNAGDSITTMAYNQRGQKTSMTDPSMGAWEYRYNIFGELVWQRDSLGRSSTMAYDTLGRIVQRTEPDLVSQWSYDTKFDGTSCGKGVGKLCEAKADNGYKRAHTYDTQGRPSSTATVLDNPSTPAVVSVTYDAVTGRMASKTWPTGYQASYVYSASGYLKQVNGGGAVGFTQTVTYEVLAMDAQGHITQYKQGNQVTTVKAYQEATGKFTGQTATKDGQATGNVLNQSYTYDSLGNLKTRADNSPGVGTQESFSYDSLNRLTLNTLLGGAVSPPTTTEVMYDARGNITYKSDVGRYWYDGSRPNRMTNITLETAPGAQIAFTGTRQLTYAFDDYKPGAQTVNGTALGNGNLEYTVSLDAVNSRHTYRGETYTSFNMPATISFGNMSGSTAGPVDRNLAFVYGPEHQRIKQTVVGGPNPGTTWYLNGEDSLGLSYEKEIKGTGITENKHYVSAGGVVFALFVQRTGTLGSTPATATSYFHGDHLGSIVAISDETGAVVERMAFDAWGKRRFVNGTPDVLDSIVGFNTDRGYTEHEHLDEMGVIHMNGRIYDPLVGRFMSADPFIQNPNNLQSFNRYSYVLNNPLASTDPSGYFSTVCVQQGTQTICYEDDGYWDDTPYSEPTETGSQPSAPSAGTHVEVCCLLEGNVPGKDSPSPISNSPVSPSPNAYNSINFATNFDFFSGDHSSPIGQGISSWWSASVAGFQSASVGETAMKFLQAMPAEAGIAGAVGMLRGTSSTGSAISKSAGQLGREGEEAVRAVTDIGPKIKSLIEINGRTRIPDGLSASVLTEIKNVKSLSLTQQLRDYSDFAVQTGRNFDLWVRESTTLSKPLIDKIESGLINFQIIPK